MDTPRRSRETPSHVVDALLKSHRRFLAFVGRRVRDKTVAEEIVQAAFAKSVEKSKDLRDGERSVAWFYRLLRNALADYFRREQAQAHALGKHALEPLTTEVDGELEKVICACLQDVIPTLKPEYASILKHVELEGASVPQAAQALAVSPNNAGVRLHRARQALRKQLVRVCGTCTEHGCLDCTCQKKKV